MKTPRHEQPWYESRLLNNKKPSPITEEERTSITDENRRLIEESASIIATGVKRGWISFPAKTEAETWVLRTPTRLTMSAKKWDNELALYRSARSQGYST